MAKVRNVSGEKRYAVEIGGRLVLPDEVIEVPDESAFGYTCQDAWEAADDPTQEIAAEQEAANTEANPPVTLPDPIDEPLVDAVDTDNLEASTIPQLTEFAANYEPPIDLGGATLKADIIAAIEAALAADEEG